MKKFCLCACAMAMLCTVSAQEFSFKKGKMSIDDVPVAKYDGKGGVFKLVTLNITTLDDQPLVSIEEKSNIFQNPFYLDAKAWLEIRFSNGTTVHYPLKDRMLEKMMLNQFFKDGKPSWIIDGKLNEEEVKAFASANTYNFQADSAAIVKMEEENKPRIAKIMPRDLSKPIVLVPVPQKSQLIKIFDLYQAEMHIGRIEKRIDPNGETYDYSYIAWIKSDPYTFDGQQYEFSPVAFIRKASPRFENDVIMMKDKSVIKFKTPAVASSEHAFAQMLINTGNL